MMLDIQKLRAAHLGGVWSLAHAHTADQSCKWGMKHHLAMGSDMI